MKKVKTFLLLHKYDIVFLGALYALGVYFRLAPRLQVNPHLLTLHADIWERLAIAQYFRDHGMLPEFCLRYIAYGNVPQWYPPISPILFASLSWIFKLDIPTVSSRIIPFIEALSPLTLFFMCTMLFNKRVACLATLFLSLTPSFVYWSGISDPQSLTLFLMPVYVMLLVWRGRAEGIRLARRIVWVLGFGFLLAVNFLSHLSFFLVVPMALLVALALVMEKKAPWRIFDDLTSAILVSQLLTVWWWLPKNLYWWWVKALVTSSGLYTTVQHLQEYGFSMAIVTICCSVALLVIMIFFRKQRKPYLLLLFFWAFLPFVETQNETILNAINRTDLTWSTIFKPLEGFRFYCFLAQPLAVIVAVAISEYAGSFFRHGWRKIIGIALVVILVTGFVYDIHKPYNWFVKIQNSGLTEAEYDAALWFREHANDTDRIIADYYRVQMFAGVCGGKALLGGLFPLRNVDFPYIKTPAVVQDDIYTIYETDDAAEAVRLMERYGATHIFYSDNMIHYGALGSKHKEGFGIDIEKEKFRDETYFKEVYNYQDEVYGEVVIIKAQ